MSYETQNWVDGPGGGTPINAKRLAHIERGIEAPTKQPSYIPRASMSGPVHTETPAFTTGIGADPAFNEQYQIINPNTLPAIWPIQAWGDFIITSDLYSPKTSMPNLGTVWTARFMYDGLDFSWISSAGYEINLYIDGRPFASNPLVPAATAGLGINGLSKLVFASARPRLIEMRTISGFMGLYGKKPYRMWKPAPDLNPKVAVVGDSYVYPSTMSNTAAGAFTPDPWMRGLYQGMDADLGISSLVTDGVPGTGYIEPSVSNLPYNHASRLAWLQRIQPDVIVVHGGGANDLANGKTVSQIVDAAVAYFKTLRTNHPDAKLVFMEGFAPPLFPYNNEYRTIRQGVQAALELAGVYVYYLDIATTRPPFLGTGYVTAPVAGENTSIYVGSDRTHYTELGGKFLRSIVAPKLRLVLADKGRLEGSLVL